MTAAGAGEAEGLKAAGNDLFKEGKFLKAAATYSRAIRLDGENAVLFRCGPTPPLSRRPPEGRGGSLKRSCKLAQS